MTQDAERAYVRGWAETGRLLEELRWAELSVLDDARALQASRDLLDLALRVPLPPARREWSGLVDQQDAFHGRRPPKVPQ